jgi:RND superfamily putative drug exporter
MIAVLTVTMLGAGVDYCLFILWRYKEERQRGKNRYIAIREATIHAGESVVSSGLTVMIGFGSLLISSFPLLNQFGLGPMVGIAFSLVAALTIIPIALHIFGDKLFYPRKFREEFKKKTTDPIDIQTNQSVGKNKIKKNQISIMKRLTHWTVKHPWPVILSFVVITALFAIKVTEIEVSYDSKDLLPQNVESVEGFSALEGNFPKGQLYPIVVVMQFSESLENESSSFYDIQRLKQIDVFAHQLQEEFKQNADGQTLVKQVNTISRPNGEPLNLSKSVDIISLEMMKQFIGSESNTTVKLNVIVDIEPLSGETLNLVGEIRTWSAEYLTSHESEDFGHSDINILVGGAPASFKDMSNIINNEAPVIIIVVLVGIFIVLYLITGSIFTPIRLELTILMSVIISLGATQIFFVEYLGSGIPWIMPVMLFVIIFGLGMDYDIFIVTRMREEAAIRGLTDEDAIIEALDQTSTIISAAGVIMAFSLGSLFIASSNILKLFGFSFFIAILLDATLIRQLLVPAIMVVAKRANWWNPIKSLSRVPSDEERKKIREETLDSQEKEVTYDDLSYAKLREFEQKFNDTNDSLKKLASEEVDLSSSESQAKIQKIKDFVNNLPGTAPETFDFTIEKINKKIVQLETPKKEK